MFTSVLPQLSSVWEQRTPIVKVKLGFQILKQSDLSIMNLTFSMGDRSGLQALIV